MTRGRKLRKKEGRKREFDKKETKSDHEDKVNNDKTVSASSIFKSDEIQDITNILRIPELDDSHSLLGAVVLGKFDVVKKLIKEGYSINRSAEDGVGPLLWAVKLKLVEMADFLIRRGADITMTDGEGNNVILLALQTPTWDQDTFLDFWTTIKDTDIDLYHANKLGNTLVHYIVKRQWDTVLELVVSTSSVNLNSVTCKGVSALMMACSRHQEATIRTLLKYKADLSLEDQRGCTALCYAIAYLVQKKLEMPNKTIEELISTLESQSNSKSSIKAYFERRLELLFDPPEDNFGHTISTVIVHVMTFATRCLNRGAEILLKLNVFKRIKDAAEKHLDDGDYILGLLGVISEIVRYCDCCMKHISKDDLFRAFNEAGFPNTCLRILKRFGASAFPNTHLHTVLLPLFLTCSHPSTKSWLQRNFRPLMQYYKNYVHNAAPLINTYPNDVHLLLVKKSSNDFKLLMNQLQKGEVIYVENEKMTKKRKNETKNSHTNKLNQDIHKYFKSTDSFATEVENSINKRRCSDDNLKQVEVVNDGKMYQENTLNNRPIMKSSKIDRDNSIAVDKEGTDQVKPEDSRDTYWTIKSSAELFRDSLSEFGEESVLKNPTIYPNWQEDFKEGCDLFGISERGSAVINPNDTKWDLKKEIGNGDMGDSGQELKELNNSIEELEKSFKMITSKFDEIWQKEYDEGYLGAQCNIDDYLKLMRTLPDLEFYHWTEVTKKWKILMEVIKTQVKEDPKQSKVSIAGLKSYLEEFDNQIKSTLSQVKPYIKLEELKSSNTVENLNVLKGREIEVMTISSEEEYTSDQSNDFIPSETSSTEDWLRTDHLLEMASSTKNVISPSGFENESEAELICNHCHDHSEPLVVNGMYVDSMKLLKRKICHLSECKNIMLPMENLTEKFVVGEIKSFGSVIIDMDTNNRETRAHVDNYDDQQFIHEDQNNE